MATSSSKIITLLKKSQPIIIVLLLTLAAFQSDFLGINSFITASSKANIEITTKANKPNAIVKKVAPKTNYQTRYYGQKTFLESKLNESKSLEEFIYKVLAPLRLSKSSPNILKRSDIEKMKMAEKDQMKNNELLSQLSMVLEFDINGDRKVTREEFDLKSKTNDRYAAKKIRKIKELDTNGDGIISFKEMTFIKPKIEKKPRRRYGRSRIDNLESLMKLDPNKDDKITFEEVTLVATNLFKKYDINNDNILADSEKDAFVKSLKKSEDKTNKENTKEDAKLALDKDLELHVVSVKKGYNYGRNGEVLVPTTKIKIDRPNKKVALFIIAGRTSKFEISATKNTQVKKIIINSYESKRSQIFLNGKAVKPSVFITRYRPKENRGSSFLKFKDEVKTRLGRDKLDSFSAAIKAPKEGFLIDKIDDNALLKLNYLKTNYGSYKTPKDTVLTMINGVIGQYNAKGELKKKMGEEVKYISLSSHLELNNFYYKLGFGHIQKRDRNGKMVERIEPPLDIPVFPKPNREGITYNKDKDSLAVISSGDTNYLYHYHLKKKKWSVISLKTKKKFQEIGYNKYSKNYVLLGEINQDNSNIELSFMDEKGKIKSQEFISLDKFIGLKEMYKSKKKSRKPGMNMFVLKDQIMITVFSTRNYYKGIERIYIYDKKSKKIYLTWVMKYTGKYTP